MGDWFSVQLPTIDPPNSDLGDGFKIFFDTLKIKGCYNNIIYIYAGIWSDLSTTHCTEAKLMAPTWALKSSWPTQNPSEAHRLFWSEGAHQEVCVLYVYIHIHNIAGQPKKVVPRPLRDVWGSRHLRITRPLSQNSTIIFQWQTHWWVEWGQIRKKFPCQTKEIMVEN